MAIPSQPNDKPKKRDPKALAGALQNLRLKIRLLKDPRVSFLSKVALVGGVVWIIFPDLIPGPVDDIFVGIMVANWEEWMCPLAVVNYHRQRLEEEAKQTIPPKPRIIYGPPTQQPNYPKYPPPVEPMPARVNPARKVVVRVNGDIAYFHFTLGIVDLINEDARFRKNLLPLGTLEGAIFKANKSKKDAIIAVLKSVGDITIITR